MMETSSGQSPIGQIQSQRPHNIRRHHILPHPSQRATIWHNDSIAHVQTYNHNDDELWRGILNGSIPSTAADSGATSSVGTKRERRHFISTGRKSDKTFRMLNGALEAALDIGHHATDVLSPARDIHIIPGVDETSLISTVKFGQGRVHHDL